MKPYSAQEVITLAIKAGQEAVRLRKLGLEITIKPDGSKVTNADLEADKIITEGLRAIAPEIEIISEESAKKSPDGTYKDAWVVDPIDGTHAFIDGKRNFSVLIGRVENNVPVEGVAYYPAHGLVYYTEGKRSFKRSVTVAEQGAIEMGPPMELKMQSTASPSLRYKQFRTNVLAEKLPADSKEHQYHQPGSILAVLEGTLDVSAYLNTMGDWDLAAHDAILRNAGGCIVSASSKKPLEYGISRPHDRAFLQDDSIVGAIETLIRFGFAGEELRGLGRQR